MADYAQKSPADKANTSAKTPSPVSPEAAGLGIEPFTHTPALHSAAAAIALQRSIGNQRIQRLIQAKLTVGAAHDPLEQEADRVAEQVVNRSVSPPIQRHHEDDEAQRSPDIARAPAPEEGELMTKRTDMMGAFDAGSDFESKLSSSGGGAPLDTQTQSQMEAGIGADFSNVRVHTGSHAASLNRAISARAFTRGSDLFFDHGQYNPGSTGGKRLLAHELTHVVQQGSAPQGTQRKAKQGEGDVQRHMPEDESALQRKPLPAAHTHNCGCPACSVQRKAQPQADVLQRDTQHGKGCTCPACSGVQRKATPMIQRHSAGCKCSTCASAGRQTQPGGDTLATLMQRTPPALSRKVNEVQRTPAQPAHDMSPAQVAIQHTSAQVIQRHSSWEHQMLGDVPPAELAKIGAWQDLIKQTELEGFYGFRKPKNKEGSITIEGVGTIKKGNVMHVLAQEMQRLALWQKNPPKGTGVEDKEKLYGKDPEWQVQLVALPAPEGEQPLIITYGEMNTLADFYGDLETMRGADPEKRRQIVQSVRQETFFRFKDIYTQLQSSLTDDEKKNKDVGDAEKLYGENELVNQILGYKFGGAIAPDYISGKAGQAELLTGAQSTGAKGETNGYGATLARNACHFVPESWHAWARYHEQARVHALEAHNARERAKRLAFELERGGLGTSEIEAKQQKMEQFNQIADQSANEALLNNGFGDHYLQDSYASGHMLNKTQIMQWYVQYLDEKDQMKYFTEQNWHKVQQMAYKQPGLAAKIMYDKTKVRGGGGDEIQGRNPQAVEDNPSEDWMDRFEALGLQVPVSLRTVGSPSRKLMEWWQERATVQNMLTGDELMREGPYKSEGMNWSALMPLIQDGIVLKAGATNQQRAEMMTMKNFKFTSGIGNLTFSLRSEYIPRDLNRFKAAKKSSSEGDDSQYQRMAASVTYSDYFEFMNSAFIQKATNALHDTFCQGGLTVISGDGSKTFKVYGDDAMFNAGSAAGVKESAITSNMSRDAILNITKTGNDAGNTTQSILTRLPDTVKVEVKDDKSKTTKTVDTSIADWHNPEHGPSLRAHCFSDVFPAMSWSLLQKLGPGVMGNLGEISRDMRVHGSEAF